MGPLNHSPADIIRHIIIDLGVGVLPGGVSPWPVFADVEPSLPDDCITVYNTSPILHARAMVDAQTKQHYGVLVRVRSAKSQVGYAKANEIVIAMEGVYLTELQLDDVIGTGATTYRVHSVNLESGPIPIGLDVHSDRYLQTVNFLMALKAI